MAFGSENTTVRDGLWTEKRFTSSKQITMGIARTSSEKRLEKRQESKENLFEVYRNRQGLYIDQANRKAPQSLTEFKHEQACDRRRGLKVWEDQLSTAKVCKTILVI
jgi:hypothetical protein